MDKANSVRVRNHLLGGLAVATLSAGGMANAEAPAVQLLSAPLVAPAGAWTTSTPHTSGIAAWAQTPPELVALARTLGSEQLAAGQMSADQYTLNVFDYVRGNLAVEFRFGLGKGARGALIDQSGTPVDQAELMVKLLRVANITASFKAGTITLTANQFGRWTGLITALNQSAQTFTVTAVAACQFLADGGIPATINGATSCSGLSGNLTTATLAHVWVSANGKLYDPAYKEHALKNSIDLPAAMNCGTASTPLCGSQVAAIGMNGVTTGTFAGSSYVQNLDGVRLGNAHANLKTKAISLQNSITSADRYKTTVEVVGGKAIAPAALTPGATLPYASAVQQTWLADVPDAFRTTLTVLAPACAAVMFYADEIAGRRISYIGDGNGMTLTAKKLLVDTVNVPSATCTGAGGNSFTVSVNHPYLAAGGSYGDDSTVFTPVEAPKYIVGIAGPYPIPQPPAEASTVGSFPVTIIHSFGDQSTSAQQFMSNLQEAQPVMSAYFCRASSTQNISARHCGDDRQPVAAETIGTYRTLFNRIVAGVTQTAITQHHDVGIIFGSRGHDRSRVSMHEAQSINSTAADSAARNRAFEIEGLALPTLEMAGASTDPNGDGAPYVNFFFPALRSAATRYFDVAPANMAALLAALPTGSTGFESWRKTQLQAGANGGYATIIAEGGEAELFYKADFRAYTIWENLKGATAPDDPLTSATRTAQVVEAASLRKKEYSVSLADGELTFTAQPDIVTGSGSFPYGLPFTRTFKGGTREREETNQTDYWLAFPPPEYSHQNISFRGSGDNDTYARLGGGWTHNFNVTAAYTGNVPKALGEDFATEAAQTIASVVVLNDLLANPTLQNRLMAISASRYLHDGLFGNAVVIKKGPASESFMRLPDDTFMASGSSSATLTTFFHQPGFRNLGLLYTGAGGDKITFTAAYVNNINSPFPAVTVTDPTFKADRWEFPDGLWVDFDYELRRIDKSSVLDSRDCAVGGGLCGADERDFPHAYVLTGVRNNLGRALRFTLVEHRDANSRITEYRISAVTDEEGRAATFNVANGPGAFACATLTCDVFTATNPSGETTRYEYLADANSTNPALIQRPDYRLRRWFTSGYNGGGDIPLLTFTYDELFRVRTIKDNLGQVTRYYAGGIAGTERRKYAMRAAPTNDLSRAVFDEHNSEILSVDPLARATAKTYDNASRLTRVTRPEGDSEERTYDVRGNELLRIRHAKPGSALADATTTMTYAEGPTVIHCVTPAKCNKVATVNDARNNTTIYTYNASGQMTRLTGPAVSGGNVRSDFCYTAFGIATGGPLSLLTGKVDNADSMRNRVTTYAYNASNKYVLSSVTVDPAASLNSSCGGVTKSGPLNLVTALTFDAVGNMRTVDGPRTDVTDVTTYSFDSARRITRIDAPLNSVTRYTYDMDGLLSTTRRARVAIPTDGNPVNPRPTDLVAGQWQTETRAYFLNGDLRSVTDAEGHVVQNGYDALGRKTLVTDPDGRRTGVVYDAAGQTSCIWKGWNSAAAPADCNWNPATYASNGNNGPLRYVANTFSGNGKTLTVADADNHLTRYQYDGLDRLQFTYFPDPANGTLCTAASEAGTPACSGLQTYEASTYDANDNRLSLRTRKADTITSTYDAMNRVATKAVSGLPLTTYGYNLRGEPVSLTSPALGSIPAHGVAYDYFDDGRRQFEETLVNGTTRRVAYAYADKGGNRTRTLWPDGYFVSYEYDALNRMSRVWEGAVGNVKLADYSYDTLSRRSGLQYAGTASHRVDYTFEPDSNLDVLTHVMGATTVTLDHDHNGSGQITRITANDAFYLPSPAVSATTAYTINHLNQYGAVGGQAATYDNNGNLLTWFPTGGEHTYAYDAENRLRTAAVAGSATASITYDYDPLGRRLSKVVGGTPTYYLLDGDEEIAEYSSTGGVLRRYITGPAIDDRIARAEGSATTAPPKYYYHVNHQGSVIDTTTVSGTIDLQLAYDEYGNLTSQPPATSSGEAFRYTGRRYDAETGLYYYRARYYTPTLGRFLQVDPVGYKDDFNLYAYTRNDPLNATDPKGTDSASCYTDAGCGGGIASSQAALETVADFTPVIGDIKGAVEAIQNPSVVNVAAAVVGIVPGVGDVASKALKTGANILENAEKGAKAEAAAVAKLGDKVAGQRVTLESSTGKRSVADIVTKNKGVVEVKSGGSPLSPGQKAVQADIAAGRQVTPRGQNAENAGLTPGQPVTMKCYTVDRCP